MKALTANTPSCSNKTYDGNKNVSCTITYSGVASGDTVTGGATCTFADAIAGTNKTVTCSSFTKGGTDNGNYSVPSGSKTATATINKANSSAPTLTGVSTVHDGNSKCVSSTGGTSGLTTEYAWRNPGGSWSSWSTSNGCYNGVGTREIKARKATATNYNASGDSNVVTLKVICPSNKYQNGTSCSSCPSGFPYSDQGSTASSQCYKSPSTRYTRKGKRCSGQNKTVYAIQYATCGYFYSIHTTYCNNGVDTDGGWSDAGTSQPSSQNSGRICNAGEYFTRQDVSSRLDWVGGGWTEVSASQCYDSGSCSYSGATGQFCHTQNTYEYNFVNFTDDVTSCSTNSYFNCNYSTNGNLYVTSCSSYQYCSSGTLSNNRCYNR